MNKHKLHIVILSCIIVFVSFSCNRGVEQKKLVVKLNDKELYLQEVMDVVPDDASKEDSIFIAQSYIEDWILSELYLIKAKENLTDEQMDFEDQIEDFRNSLIIHTYQQEILNQKFKGSDISDEEIEEYYKNHKDAFSSHEANFQISYFIGPVEGLDKDKLKELIRNAEANVEDFERFCFRHAVDFYAFGETWYSKDEIKPIFPDDMQYKINNIYGEGIVEYSDSTNYYAIMVHHVQTANQTKTLDMVKDEIKEIMIYERQMDFLKQFEQDMIKEAEEKSILERTIQ